MKITAVFIFIISLFHFSCTHKKTSNCTLFSSKSIVTPPSAWNKIQHVVVVILENKHFLEVYNLPFHRFLAEQGAVLLNQYAITHPSQPNYIALISGSQHNVQTNDNVTLKANHLGDLIENAGKTWKVYAQGYPGQCFLGAESGAYVRRHVPFLSFENITSNLNRCSLIMTEEEFDHDIQAKNLPNFSLFVPDNNNNGHDTTAAFADNWLRSKFENLIKNSEIMSNTLFIFTYDESSVGVFQPDNHIYTAYVGAGIKKNSVQSDCINHYGTLSTIEKIMNLGSLHLNDFEASVVLDIWED